MKQEFRCSGCGASVLKYLSQLTRTDIVFCSLSCRNKNYKKVLPEWHPRNYREYHHTCICCQKQFTTTGRNYSSKKRQYCSRKCQAKHLPRKPHSLATKVKLSQRAVQQNKNYLSKHVYNGTQGYHVMKSSWEVKFALYLDQIGQGWIYEPEFKLSNGYSYLPDFQLSTGDIIEIKGYMRDDAQKKWDLFCSDYPMIKKSLLRKDDLKKLGILH